MRRGARTGSGREKKKKKKEKGKKTRRKSVDIIKIGVTGVDWRLVEINFPTD